MTQLVSKFTIKHNQPGVTRLQFGEPNYIDGDSIMYYHCEFEAETFSNVSMEYSQFVYTPEEPEYPPRRVGDIGSNKYVFDGLVSKFPNDEIDLVNMKSVLVRLITTIDNASQIMDVTIINLDGVETLTKVGVKDFSYPEKPLFPKSKVKVIVLGAIALLAGLYIYKKIRHPHWRLLK